MANRKARTKDIALLVSETLSEPAAVNATTDGAGVPSNLFLLVELRASQINRCSVCVRMHSRQLQQAGEPAERILAVAAWRDAPCFTAAERAVLALTEAVTRLSDREDPVPDSVWSEAARFYGERSLATLLSARSLRYSASSRGSGVVTRVHDTSDRPALLGVHAAG